ncbi:MAG: tyrosine-type recombinase/integrase [Methanobacteriaceae archaeon]
MEPDVMQESEIEIFNDPYFVNFIRGRNLSEATERIYAGRLRSFFEFVGKNPSQLINKAQKDGSPKLDKLFNDYIENLKKSGKSSNTIINRLDTVKAFYHAFNVDTKNINKINLIEPAQLVDNKIVSLDQVKEALELSNLRDKAIILLHLSSGMEATELRCLTYGDFINSIAEYIDLEPKELFNVKKIANELLKINEIVGTWKIEKNRTGKPYVTFNTPESTKAILSYLIDRKRKNKVIKSPNDPLFVNSQNQTLKKSSHGSIFKRVNNRANFGYLTKKRRFFSSTMLRKYFKNKLNESGMDESTINALLGQKLDDNIDYYSDNEIKVLKNKYIGALDELSINKVTIEKEIIIPDEYKKLMDRLNEKENELEAIKKHLKQIEQVMNSKDV